MLMATCNGCNMLQWDTGEIKGEVLARLLVLFLSTLVKYVPNADHESLEKCL